MRRASVLLLAAFTLPLASCFNTPDAQSYEAFDRGCKALQAADPGAADAHFSAAVRFEPLFARAHGGRAGRALCSDGRRRRWPIWTASSSSTRPPWGRHCSSTARRSAPC